MELSEVLSAWIFIGGLVAAVYVVFVWVPWVRTTILEFLQFRKERPAFRTFRDDRAAFWAKERQLMRDVDEQRKQLMRDVDEQRKRWHQDGLADPSFVQSPFNQALLLYRQAGWDVLNDWASGGRSTKWAAELWANDMRAYTLLNAPAGWPRAEEEEPAS
jgi:hypothetical protein